jgi:hypothetical protein
VGKARHHGRVAFVKKGKEKHCLYGSRMTFSKISTVLFFFHLKIKKDGNINTGEAVPEVAIRGYPESRTVAVKHQKMMNSWGDNM